MNRTLFVCVLVVFAAAIAGGVLWLRRPHNPGSVSVTLRISVTPDDQTRFVSEQANSSKFKYLTAKLTGSRPALAQKLVVKTVPNSPGTLEAQVLLMTKEEGEHYGPAFIETLQTLCGTQAQVRLASQAVH
jgi:hypothetical protein